MKQRDLPVVRIYMNKSIQVNDRRNGQRFEEYRMQTSGRKNMDIWINEAENEEKKLEKATANEEFL